jgi:ferric-dicitrate binding protein FerR (iron transport regulator)
MTGDKIDKERLNRIFKGESTNEDEQFLLELFHDKTLTDELKCQMKRQWYEVCSQESVPEKNLDHILYKLNYDINACSERDVKPVLRFIKRAAGIAAVIVFMISLCTAIYYKTRSEGFNKTWTEIKAPAWTQASFILPDSSKIWLNSRSSIKYRGDFLSERSVILDGEAYFDVQSDKTHPFTVEADNLIIKALGTRFNVASYDDERNMEIVLEEGELLINDRELKRSVKVTPDELITYYKNQDEFRAACVQTKSYVSWKEGKLVFRNDPIDVIARRLGRWYNVDVEIKGHDFDQLRLRATFVEENLEEVLWYLGRSLPIKCKTVEGGVLSGDDFTKKKVIITLL